MKMWMAAGEESEKQQIERLRSKIIIISGETYLITIDGHFIGRLIFLANSGAPGGMGPSSSSFCPCILHTWCPTFTMCSEPIKADGVS